MIILDAIRTPFCKMGTSLSSLSAADLGRHATVSLLSRTGIDPGELSEVIFGCVAQPADTANLARVIALRSGIPEHVPASTVHRNCASGLEAISTAAERIAAGQGDLFLVGGVESMSQVPFLFSPQTAAKYGALARAKSLGRRIRVASTFRPRDFRPLIGLKLGLTDPFTGMNMGQTAEVLARELGISREDQDLFAADSHHKALLAQDAHAEELAPLPVKGEAVTSDNGVRNDSTPERLARLRTVFDRRYGTVTAGNSSQITDGAVALLVASEARARRLGIEPMGRLVDYAYAGCDPKRMGLGPVFAIEKLLSVVKRRLIEADVVEINEAFAAQVLAVLKALRDRDAASRVGLYEPLGEVPPVLVNPQGGSIALGHPVGATGARLVQTALSQLKRNGGRSALATACVGGGQGAAMWLERLN